MKIKDLQKNRWKIDLLKSNIPAPSYCKVGGPTGPKTVWPSFSVDQYLAKKGTIELYIYTKTGKDNIYRFGSTRYDYAYLYSHLFKMNLTTKYKYSDFEKEIREQIKKDLDNNNYSIKFEAENAKRKIKEYKTANKNLNKMIKSLYL